MPIAITCKIEIKTYRLIIAMLISQYICLRMQNQLQLWMSFFPCYLYASVRKSNRLGWSILGRLQKHTIVSQSSQQYYNAAYFEIASVHDGKMVNGVGIFLFYFYSHICWGKEGGLMDSLHYSLLISKISGDFLKTSIYGASLRWNNML